MKILKRTNILVITIHKLQNQITNCLVKLNEAKNYKTENENHKNAFGEFNFFLDHEKLDFYSLLIGCDWRKCGLNSLEFKSFRIKVHRKCVLFPIGFLFTSFLAIHKKHEAEEWVQV